MIEILLMAAFSVLFSAVIARMVIAYSVRRSLFDVPNHRSSHTNPTPRGGGVAIVLTYFIALCWFYFTDFLPNEVMCAIFGGGSMVAFIGFIDDLRQVRVIWRIMVHILAVCWAVFCLQSYHPIVLLPGLPVQVGVKILVLAGIPMVWLLNLFNFMDGIDGIAGVEAVSVALFGATIIYFKTGTYQQAEVLLLVLYAAACSGFLFWNWPPAKIFMGDVGSGFIGYTMGVFVMLTLISESMTLPSWLILLGVFVVDATVTLIMRMINGECWYEAHCSHAYQKAARRLFSHRKVTYCVLLINIIWLFPLAFVAAIRPEFGWLLLFVSWTPLIVVVFRERLISHRLGLPNGALR